MFYKDNNVFQLIAAFFFGFGAGITVGFYLTGNRFMTLLIALIIGVFVALVYITYLIFST